MKAPMTLVFEIDRDDLPPARVEEYKALLNEMLGVDGQWQIVSKPVRECVPSVTNEPDPVNGSGT